ncbi:unnamed protein product [Ambrosiozyma monospora]|uniref:Unnamed protein product n=1 Tax=Ambrosiozyma monospora TaxID=43982 RepID=A0ACB5U9Z6_AMBMO|nr:unnamed protein product [Ambrosiozyma monospora]
MDSKKLKKLQKQERLKKRLFTQLHMTDNDNFEFEEEKLLHSSRSFRDRQRIDYNENKRPPRSTATAPAHTVTTRSTDHHANAKSTSDPPTSTDSNTADKQHVKPSDPASKSVVRTSGHTTLTLKYGKQSPSPEEEAPTPLQRKVKSGNGWSHKKVSKKRRMSGSPTSSKLHPGQIRGTNGRFQKKKKKSNGSASISTADPISAVMWKKTMSIQIQPWISMIHWMIFLPSE